MKKISVILLVFMTLLSYKVSAQAIDETYPKEFTIPTDSIEVEFSTAPMKKYRYKLPVSPGTDGRPDITTTVYLGENTVILPHKNFPYEQRITIPVTTPNGKHNLVMRYNRVVNFFSQNYMEKYAGKTQIQLPEVYELANIIWALAPISEKDTTLIKKGNYYEKVKKYFSAYLNHPLFDKFNFPDSIYSRKYYDFRENSFCYEFNNNEIIKGNTYFYVMGDDWYTFHSLFEELLPLVEDFAEKSNFREFYKTNQSYYNSQLNKLQSLIPLYDMWAWLEREFPDIKIQSYKIIFSPLIGGSHSTQIYATWDIEHEKLFQEAVMFICGPDRYEKLPGELNKGMMSGIVFTEIDHNYVNPTTIKYRERVDKIFKRENGWDIGQNSYNSPEAVFNEYMTHSLFCLWVNDTFEKNDADYIISYREDLNVDKRGFVKFREFNRALMDMRDKNKNLKVTELYPMILDWCEK